MIYKKKIKNAFLESDISQTHKRKAQKVFERIGRYEKEIGKDISQMNEKELLECLGYIEVVDIVNVIRCGSALRNYVQYIKTNSVLPDVSDAITKINFEDVDVSQFMSDVYFFSTEELVKEYQKYSKRSETHPEIIVWLLQYYGIDVSKAVSLDEHDVNLQEQIINCDGKIIYIDDVTTAVMETYQSLLPKTLTCNTFIKRLDDTPHEAHQIGMMTSKFNTRYYIEHPDYLWETSRFCQNSLNDGGLMHRLYEAEKAGAIDLSNSKTFNADILNTLKPYRIVKWMYINYQKALVKRGI